MKTEYPLGHPLNPIIGDLWDQPGTKIIPVNTDGVHGRGVAKQAALQGLISSLNRSIMDSPDRGVYTLAVKGNAPDTRKYPGAAWSERVTGENLELIRGQFWTLKGICPRDVLYSPMVGLGFGEGDPDEIMPILIWAYDLFEGQLRFVEPDAETLKRHGATLRPGVRKDVRVG